MDDFASALARLSDETSCQEAEAAFLAISEEDCPSSLALAFDDEARASAHARRR